MTTLQIETPKSNLKNHIANQYKRMISNKKNQKNAWPLDFSQSVSKERVCPESWAVLSINH